MENKKGRTKNRGNAVVLLNFATKLRSKEFQWIGTYAKNKNEKNIKKMDKN
jgi:hypothetical protein